MFCVSKALIEGGAAMKRFDFHHWTFEIDGDVVRMLYKGEIVAHGRKKRKVKSFLGGVIPSYVNYGNNILASVKGR